MDDQIKEDIAALPEIPKTYEAALDKINALIVEANECQQRLLSLDKEIAFYQGVAKTLEPSKTKK